jgi:eukaryotic-like serine/threonine-protein kinase
MPSASEIRSADPFLGKLIDGRFKVEQFLGAGAVGSVYRALDRGSSKRVALKIWNGTALNQQTRGRFEREATALITLRHPNIVDVHGYGMVDQLPYVAMEYLDGQPIEAFLKDGQPLDPALALDVITQILQALAYAHGLGVVHRDLKPDNVVLVQGPRGQRLVKLLDFGLAKFLSPDDDPVKGAALTMMGMVMGTPIYMAPEQAAGKAVDVRVDVYAAGCVLFEMLVGHPPFLGESNAELFRAHLLKPVPKLAELRPDMRVAPGLQEWLETALAKRPEQRFPHAGQMLEALAALPAPLLRRQNPTQPPADDLGAPRLRLEGLPLDEDAPRRRSDSLPLIAALITGLCTAAALAYALLF